ncbi:hypothetical protein DL764_007451 [Monosporascus ibericus]|uniref:Conserved oligomeric Golgi complex subunit 1 n=1 Tax=Monosporascus ibericus TaxID=155417 RepID=A0A4Q4T2R4_9PEZI|nr:hypothetical protein DL764_007451 [Monosporascus ibericus]
MATPDTSTLTDPSQVFTSYTLPQVRAIHKALHVQVDEKSVRLRTQVGNSYRDLLGTADTIVQMRQDMRDVQDVLGRMGDLCGREMVSSKVKGLSSFRGRSAVNTRTGQLARLKLLEACRLTVTRLLKGGHDGKGDRLLLAAKTLVLSRLLVSSFSSATTADEDIEPEVDTAKKNLGSLRRRLLGAIEKILEKTGDSLKQTDIVKVLCAYSLASSSGARDVLRHFLSARKEAVVREFDCDESQREKGPAHVLHGLKLYTQTLLDVQALVPNRLSEALASIKKEPLLADESLRAVEGLRLDVYEKWCGDDIQYFTLFIRHDDLEGAEARDMLMGWARNGCDTLLSGLGKTLEIMSEFKAIVNLRTSVLEYWIRNGGKPRGFDPSVMLDGLRKAVNNRLTGVLDAKVAKLRLVGSEVAATLESWKTGTTERHNGLWDEEMLAMDVSSGANQIAHEVISRLYGRNEAVSRAVTCYQSWYQLIDDVGDLVEQLKGQRWDNDLDEIEDEDVIEARQKLLSKDDPQLLHERLQHELKTAFGDLEGQITALWQSRKDGANSGQVAMYILRILRDVRAQLPNLDDLRSFGLGEVPSLHQSLAEHVSIAPIDDFALSVLTGRRVVGRTLWEGDPALPTHPSPGTFTLLRNLVMAMGNSGLDLWTPAAVQTLKQVFSVRLVDIWRKEVEESGSGGESEAEKGTNSPDESGTSAEKEDEPPGTNEETASNTGAKLSHDLLVQWLYDVNILQHCLETNATSDEALSKLSEDIYNMTGLGGDARDKITKASQEYWKRTCLLFGLLT